MSINVVFSKKPESDPIYTGPTQQFPISPRPVVWDRDNTVYVGNPGSTHWDLHQEFTDANSGDFDEGYVMDRRTNDLFASDSIDNEVWWKGEGRSAEFSGEFGLGLGDPHQQEIGDAILEALGGTNTFMSKQAGWNDVMQWSGDALDWVSEKGLDADAAMHSRIHPEGCDDNECWVCNEGQRPNRFETPDVE